MHSMLCRKRAFRLCLYTVWYGNHEEEISERHRIALEEPETLQVREERLAHDFRHDRDRLRHGPPLLEDRQ